MNLEGSPFLRFHEQREIRNLYGVVQQRNSSKT